MSIFVSTTSIYAENKNPKVVVIGGGLAGLTTAYRLHKQGVDVDLYEARNRIGGRIFTVKVGGNIAELGGHNITDGGDALHINHLIEELDLTLTQTQVSLDHSYWNGENLISVAELLREKQFDPQILGDQLDELALTSHTMKEVLAGMIEENDPLYKVASARLAAYEGGPIDQLSPFYADTLFHMLLGGLCSVHPGSKEQKNYLDLISIKGGNSLLPIKLASLLGTQLHLNMPLKQVAKAKDNSFILTFHTGEKIRADIVVLAIPCSVYEDIIFEENVIPLEKLKNIQSIQYGANAKILVPFFHTPLKTAGVINDQVLCFFVPAQTALTGYCIGKTSLFSHETIQDSYLQMRPMIETNFGEDCPPFASPVFAEDQSFVAYDVPVGYSWPNDPYAKGSYSYISSGQEALLTEMSEENGECVKTLFAPLDQKLYFAGEHASILIEVPGTMEAACESGERTARMILQAWFK